MMNASRGTTNNATWNYSTSSAAFTRNDVVQNLRNKLPIGISNTGKSDWFSTLTQLLFHIPAVRLVIFQLQTNNGKVADLCKEMQLLFAVMQDRKQKSVSPLPALRALDALFPGEGVLNTPKNAVEMFRRLLSTLQVASSSDVEESKLTTIFGGIMQVLYRGQPKEKKEIFSFPLNPNMGNLERAMDAAFCGQERSIVEAPPVILFPIVRSSYGVRSSQVSPMAAAQKKQNHFEFPREMFFDRFLDGFKQKFASAVFKYMNCPKLHPSRSEEFKLIPYDLHAIIMHKGDTVRNGHYFMFVRHPTSAKGWLRCDDCSVCEVSWKRVCDMAYGGEGNQTSTMALVYMRRSDSDWLCGYEMAMTGSDAVQDPFKCMPHHIRQMLREFYSKQEYSTQNSQIQSRTVITAMSIAVESEEEDSHSSDTGIGHSLSIDTEDEMEMRSQKKRGSTSSAFTIATTRKVRVAIVTFSEGRAISTLLQESKLSDSLYEISAVFVKNGICPAREIAKQHFLCVKNFKTSTELGKKLKQCNIDIICMDEYVQTLSDDFLDQWLDRTLHVSPTLSTKKNCVPYSTMIERGVEVAGCIFFRSFPHRRHQMLVADRQSFQVSANATEDQLKEMMLSVIAGTYPRALENLIKEMRKEIVDC